MSIEEVKKQPLLPKQSRSEIKYTVGGKGEFSGVTVSANSPQLVQAIQSRYHMDPILGDCKIQNGGIYWTKQGLNRLAEQEKCAGVHVQFIHPKEIPYLEEMYGRDAAKNVIICKAILFKSQEDKVGTEAFGIVDVAEERKLREEAAAKHGKLVTYPNIKFLLGKAETAAGRRAIEKAYSVKSFDELPQDMQENAKDLKDYKETEEIKVPVTFDDELPVLDAAPVKTEVKPEPKPAGAFSSTYSPPTDDLDELIGPPEECMTQPDPPKPIPIAKKETKKAKLEFVSDLAEDLPPITPEPTSAPPKVEKELPPLVLDSPKESKDPKDPKNWILPDYVNTVDIQNDWAFTQFDQLLQKDGHAEYAGWKKNFMAMMEKKQPADTIIEISFSALQMQVINGPLYTVILAEWTEILMKMNTQIQTFVDVCKSQQTKDWRSMVARTFPTLVKPHLIWVKAVIEINGLL